MGHECERGRVQQERIGRKERTLGGEEDQNI
jgi:hypothetical protein